MYRLLRDKMHINYKPKHHYGRGITTRKNRWKKEKELGITRQPKKYVSKVTPLNREIGLKILELARL